MTTSMRNLNPTQLAVLIDYSEGRLLARDAIEKLDLDDYADIVIEMSQRDLPFPRPSESEARDRSLALASAILQPRLRVTHPPVRDLWSSHDPEVREAVKAALAGKPPPKA